MATLFHQQQQKNNRNNNNNTTSNNNTGSGSGPQGNLTIKKLANGHTMLMGGGSSGGSGITPQTLHTANGQILTTVGDQQIQQNHAPGTTIILTSDQNGYSLPAKFVLPSTVAAAGGVGGGGAILHQSHQQQHQPQIIQLAPQQLSGVPGAYQIVSAPGHPHSHQQQAQLIGGAKGTTTATTTLTKVPTMMMANGLNNTQPKIISISNNSVIGGGAAGGGGGTPMIINGNGHPQQQHQLVSAGGNFLRIVPAGSMNNLVANHSVSGSLGGLGGGGTHQVIQVMGADGRIMTLTGIKKQGLGTTTAVGGRIGAGVVTQLHQNNNNKTAVTFAALQQAQQQHIVTTAGGQMISAMRPVVGGGVTQVSGAAAPTTAAGTIILDKAVTTTTANRISTGVGIAAQSNNNNNNNLNNHHQQQHPQQSQQQSMVVAANLNTNNHANHSHLRNSTNTFTANDLQSNSAINGLKMQHHTTSAPQLNPPPINTTTTNTTTAATTESVPEVPPTSEGGAGESALHPDNIADPPAAAATEGDAEGEGDEPEIDIVINNVVCSFSVRCHLNLRDIALNGHNVEFRRENGMVTMKLRKPYTTASMWSSGKITCTGATSEEQVRPSRCSLNLSHTDLFSLLFQAKVAARRYARCLQKLEFKTRLHNFRIVNVLGTCHMPWDIKITNFSERHREDASYEPELHPGVTYKLKTPKATLKIFSTGSVTVTGKMRGRTAEEDCDTELCLCILAPSVSIVQEAIEFIFPLLYEFRKERPKEVQRPVSLAAEGVLSSSDEDVYGADSDENVTKEGRLKEDSFWSDEDENGKSVAGRGYLTGGNSVAKKRRFEGKSSGSKAPKVGRFAKNSKPHRRRRPLGKASNDPNEDVMGVSDDDF